MDRYRPVPGTLIEDLDTPCLLVDLDALEHNMDRIADTYQNTSCKMRPHFKNLKSPPLAHMQIRRGGTVGGLCAAKVSEAEVMVEAGIVDVLITNQVVTRDKIARVVALARHAAITVAVDDADNLYQLSDMACRHGVTIGVVIEVDTSMRRAGIRNPAHGVKLAQLSQSLPGVAFRGVMSHQTLSGQPDRATRTSEGRRYIAICLEVKAAIEAAGLPVELVSSGETWTYDIAPDIAGVTEVEGGTYALMSTQYSYMEEFQFAVQILGTVISTPRADVAIGNVGTAALAAPEGVLPSVARPPGITVEAVDLDYIVLRSAGTSCLRRGDAFILYSGQQDIMVDRWDQFIGVRKGVVETVWEITARGCRQ